MTRPLLRRSNVVLFDSGFCLALATGLFGLTLLAGPPTQKQAAAYETARGIAPIELWGAVLLALGIAKLVALLAAQGWEPPAWAGWASSTFAFFWASLLLVNAVDHGWAGLGGVILWSLVAAMHVNFSRAARREMARA